MPGTPQAPRVLPPKAARLWQRAFSEAYEGTCADKPEPEREACAAAMAWERVRSAFRKDGGGHWVKRGGIGMLTAAARKIGLTTAVMRAAQRAGFMRSSPLPFESDAQFTARAAANKPAFLRRRAQFEFDIWTGQRRRK